MTQTTTWQQRVEFEEWVKTECKYLPLDLNEDGTDYSNPFTSFSLRAYRAGFEEAWQHVSG
jgi:hypothetical protein